MLRYLYLYKNLRIAKNVAESKHLPANTPLSLFVVSIKIMSVIRGLFGILPNICDGTFSAYKYSCFQPLTYCRKKAPSETSDKTFNKTHLLPKYTEGNIN